MYIPTMFEMKDWPEIERHIRNNPLATVVSRGNDFPIATHVPLELDSDESGRTTLTGHVAKENPQWKLFETQPDVLAVFLSPIQHYISSSWYSKPNVPTWNYMSVHVFGKARIVGEERLKELLRKMTNYHEHISSHPITPEVLEKEIEKQIGGIVGIEIKIDKVEASFKMSQNRDDTDYANIIRELERLDEYNAKMIAKKMSAMRRID
ncbi:MAG TPA: FMN-binding negative transcriptional regulator [Candidatus Kryptonia bacterium]